MFYLSAGDEKCHVVVQRVAGTDKANVEEQLIANEKVMSVSDLKKRYNS